MCPFYRYCACFSPIHLLLVVSSVCSAFLLPINPIERHVLIFHFQLCRFIFYGDAKVSGQCGLLQIRGQLSMNHPILHGIASIHTPRVGRDCSRIHRRTTNLYFNPHAPGGARHQTVTKTVCKKISQLTNLSIRVHKVD